MRARIASIVAGLFAVLGVVAIALPAQADVRVNHGKDWAKVDYATVKVCDKEFDGHRVWAEGQLRDGSTWELRDKNGPKKGCGKEEETLPVYTIKICEKTKGCRSS